MAIDTKSLSQLIAKFSKLQTKDSITPESLGYILQRIADLLATAGTSETQAILGNWYNALSQKATSLKRKKSPPSILTAPSRSLTPRILSITS